MALATGAPSVGAVVSSFLPNNADALPVSSTAVRASAAVRFIQCCFNPLIPPV